MVIPDQTPPQPETHRLNKLGSPSRKRNGCERLSASWTGASRDRAARRKRDASAGHSCPQFVESHGLDERVSMAVDKEPVVALAAVDVGNPMRLSWSVRSLDLTVLTLDPRPPRCLPKRESRRTRDVRRSMDEASKGVDGGGPVFLPARGTPVNASPPSSSHAQCATC